MPLLLYSSDAAMHLLLVASCCIEVMKGFSGMHDRTAGVHIFRLNSNKLNNGFHVETYSN